MMGSAPTACEPLVDRRKALLAGAHAIFDRRDRLVGRASRLRRQMAVGIIAQLADRRAVARPGGNRDAKTLGGVEDLPGPADADDDLALGGAILQ